MANTSQIETKTLTEGSTGGSELFTWLPRTGDRDIKVWNPAPDSGWWSWNTKDEPPNPEET